MALITCRECQTPISDQASACIHCGCPVTNTTGPAGGAPDPRCTHCRQSYPIGSRFCTNCGVPVATPPRWPTRGAYRPSKDSIWEKLAGLIGFAIAFAFFHLPAEGLAIKVLAGVVVGFLIGLIPYKAANSRGRSTLAIWSCVVCTIAGGFGGILGASPVALGLYLWIRGQPT
jgi:hypothetical protein